MGIHSWKICKLGGCDNCCDNQDCDGINCEECSLGATATSQAIFQDPLWPFDGLGGICHDYANQYIWGVDLSQPSDLDDYIDNLQKMLNKALKLKCEQVNYTAYPQMIVPYKPVNIKVI